MKSIIILALLLLFVSLSFAGEVSTAIKYIAGENVYLDAGKLAGIQKGDKAVVFQDDEEIGLLEIIFVADNSSSCRILEGENLSIGSSVVVTITDVIETDELEDSEPLEPDEDFTETSSTIPSQFTGKRPHLSGKISAEYYYLNNNEDQYSDISRPGLTFRLKAKDLLPDHNLIVYSRFKRTSYSNIQEDQTEWSNRIYRVSLEKYSIDNVLNYRIGRISQSSLAGIGLFDGLSTDYKLNSTSRIGFFSGFKPDYENTRPDTKRSLGGIYFNRHVERENGWKGKFTYALVGQYTQGEIDREFFYWQFNQRKNKLYFNFSYELDLNRGWRTKDEGAITISGTFVSMNYRATEQLTLDASYDERKLIRRWETKDTPDSLFDDSYRRGIRGGFRYKINSNTTTSLRITRRGLPDEDGHMLYYADLYQRKIPVINASLQTRFSYFDNEFSSGYQPSISLRKSFRRIVDLGLQFGQNTFEQKADKSTDTINWMRMSASKNISRNLTLFSYFEMYESDQYGSNSILVDMTYRF